ncbi:MAG: hypothetical protein M0R17_13430 [Candidatus Omnitrophica bacterium]|jgi:hypothetical protein|nr:hypothetical protein [Candidatus Omnitrophota bacterium]
MKHLHDYIEKYIEVNKEDFSEIKTNKLRQSIFNYEDVIGIYCLIVKELNDGWKPDFKKHDRTNWGFVIYYNKLLNDLGGHDVYVGGFNWYMCMSAENAYVYFGDHSCFKTKKIAKEAIKIMGEDFLKHLFRFRINPK